MNTVLRKCGVFQQPGAVTAEVRRRCVDRMLSTTGAPAPLERAQGDEYFDPATRHATVIEVDAADRLAIDRVFASATGELERFFGDALAAPPPADFVVYPAGGFFRPHRDAPARGHGSTEAGRRRVTAVIVLNDRGEPPSRAQYAGGVLTLYGLIEDEAWRSVGFPVHAAAGELVAFRSATLHEVTPVTAGVRCVAVTWFGGVSRP